MSSVVPGNPNEFGIVMIVVNDEIERTVFLERYDHAEGVIQAYFGEWLSKQRRRGVTKWADNVQPPRGEEIRRFSADYLIGFMLNNGESVDYFISPLHGTSGKFPVTLEVERKVGVK